MQQKHLSVPTTPSNIPSSSPSSHSSIKYLTTQIYFPSHQKAVLIIATINLQPFPPSAFKCHQMVLLEGFVLVVHSGSMATGCSAGVINPQSGYMQSVSVHGNTLPLSIQQEAQAGRSSSQLALGCVCNGSCRRQKMTQLGFLRRMEGPTGTDVETVYVFGSRLVLLLC